MPDPSPAPAPTAPDADPSDPGRAESPAERMDRNWNELLQELRVAQTGVQILFAFLLVLPFQQRFTTLGPHQRALFVAVLLLVTLSALLILGPVVAHRVVFRRRLKAELVAVADHMVKASFVSLGLALIGGVGLAVDLVTSRAQGLAIVGCVTVVMLGLWFVLPLVMRARGDRRDEATPPRTHG